MSSKTRLILRQAGELAVRLGAVTSLTSIFCIATGDPQFYRSIMMPAVARLMDAETAHRTAVKLASYGLVPRGRDIKEDKEILVSI